MFMCPAVLSEDCCEDQAGKPSLCLPGRTPENWHLKLHHRLPEAEIPSKTGDMVSMASWTMCLRKSSPVSHFIRSCAISTPTFLKKNCPSCFLSTNTEMFLVSRAGVRKAGRGRRKKGHPSCGDRSSEVVWGGLDNPFRIVLLQQEGGGYTEVT